MSTLYILQNQFGYFLGSKGLSKQSGKAPTDKQHEWLDGRDPGALFKTVHKDEAVNIQFEVNASDYQLRLSIKECEASPKKHPIILEEDLPEPLPKVVDEPTTESEQASDEEVSLEPRQNDLVDTL